jgi:hypothetical protein
MEKDESENVWIKFLHSYESLELYHKELEVKKNFKEKKGTFYGIDGIKVIPYNHWKKDTEWSIMVLDSEGPLEIFQIAARTHEEAILKALELFYDT